ncbi:MAG: SusC/RagA family TonB-linked outer membrane protein [Bacteroidales bacterium]|nr:SusC/RagA family TonB-linked outer membrane protein [Bacteroidales bacterium]
MGTMRNSASFLRGSLLTLLLFGFAVGIASAQERTVKGKVTSEEEGPLPGVNVVVQGTLQGTVTDADGNYSLTVPGPETVLVYSYVSYTSQSVTVGDQSTIDVVLAPSATALGEIVVIGYGTQKRNEVTSAVSTVRAEDFNKGSVNSPVQLIQGKVAGLAISKAGGNPNEGYEIRLRGLNTIGANTAPLVVIDGVIGGDLGNVDPNDVENISVLKDGSGAAIYGSRGSSGVILITTKKGRAGVATIEYNGYVTTEMVAKNPDVMSASQWRALSDQTGLGTDFGGETDWFDEIEQTAISHVHNISMTGGTEKTFYRASINYRDADGVMINSGNNQLNGRLNLTQKAFNDKLTIDLNIGATERNAEYGFPTAFRYATLYNPTAPVRSDDPLYDQYDGYFQQVLFDYYNPVSILELNKSDGKDRLTNVSIKGTYEIVSGLKFDAFYARQMSSGLRGEYLDKNDYWGGMNRNGLASRTHNSSNSQLFETTLRWNGKVVSDLDMTVLGGYSYQDFSYEGFYAQGGDFLTDIFDYNNLSAALDFKNGLGTITSYKNSNKLIAFFGRMNLNYKETVFLMASARYEGSSRFGADNKWGLFPAVSAGVELAKFLNVSAIDNLKFRINYGVTGNQPGSSYLSLLRLGPQSNNFFYNGEFLPSYGPVSNANPDLKWERQGEFDAGFDFTFFQSKLFGSIDFFTRTTTDLLFEYEVPVPPNLFSQAWLNLGEIKSSGIELTLNYNAIQKSDFTYSFSLSPSYNLENKLVSLSGEYNGAELKYGTQDLANMGSPGQNQVPLVRVEEGAPLGQIYCHRFVEIDEGGNLILRDSDENGTVDQADRRVVGNGLPKFLIGFGNDFTYKNWDLNIFFRGVFGHDLANSFRALYEVPNMIGSYNVPATATDLKNSTTGTLMNTSQGNFSDYHVENASFVSLDNASLGYNFNIPSNWKFTRIRLYLAGNNLFYITKYKGVDPNPRYRDSETGSALVPGIDRRDTYFRTRSVTFGANIVF